MNILIAEDDAISAKVLRRTLENLGHKVTAAENGERAWKLFQQAHFQVVISDWMMPDIDGLELCRRIRRRQDAPYVYLMLLTAKGRHEDRLEGMHAGADDFLVKPMDKEELAERLGVARRVLTTQEELAESMAFAQVASRRFSTLFLNVPVACVVYDAHGRIREWNRACETLFGMKATEVFEKTFWDTVCRPENADEGRRQMERALSGVEIENLEWRYPRSDGELRYMLCTIFPLRGPDNGVVGAISTHMDITERRLEEERISEQLRLSVQLNQAQEQREHNLREMNSRLSTLAATDSLTGLKNRQAFKDMLDTYAAIARRQNTVYSIIMADVDLFKRYNDTFGHLAGDEALKCVANILQEQIRKSDMVARYGGEEFIFLLPATGVEGSQEVAERLRVAIEQYSWPRHPITASFGVATITQDSAHSGAMPVEKLIEAADAALYHAKEMGRNRIAHHISLPESRAA